MTARSRPLSPHLEVYRWQISNTLSILHRLTGVALAVGLVALTYWLIALASGAEAFAKAQHLFATPIGLLLLFGWTFAFLYHLLNGVRHLMWDAGYGFGRRERHLSGWVTVVGAVLLTLGASLYVWHGMHP